MFAVEIFLQARKNLLGKVDFLEGKIPRKEMCFQGKEETVKGGEIRPGATMSHVFGKVKGATGSLLPDSR